MIFIHTNSYNQSSPVLQNIRLTKRNVPEDDGFMMPKRYRQPINSYLKACGCLVTNGKFLISAFKRKINIWEIKSSDITFSWIAHSELIGQLEARGNILGKW